MLESLKIFVDLVETQSFSRAAALNYLTQSAVSQRIRLLEDELEHQLVVRGRGHLMPTEAGRVFYNASREILARFANVRDELNHLRDVVSGTVRVGTITSVGLHELPPYVKTYLKEYPAVNLHIEYLISKDVYEGLLNLNLDLGIVAFAVKHPQITSIPFRHDQMVMIAPPEHPLARHKTVRLPKLDGQPFIAFQAGIPTRKMTDKLLRQHGVSVKIVHQFDNIETIKRAVEVGAGLSIVPSKTVEWEIQSQSLKGIAIKESGLERPISVIHRNGRSLSPAAQKFIEVLTENA